MGCPVLLRSKWNRLLHIPRLRYVNQSCKYWCVHVQNTFVIAVICVCVRTCMYMLTGSALAQKTENHKFSPIHRGLKLEEQLLMVIHVISECACARVFVCMFMRMGVRLGIKIYLSGRVYRFCLKRYVLYLTANDLRYTEYTTHTHI